MAHVNCLFIPFQDLKEIILFRVLHILFGNPVVRLGYVVQIIPEYDLNLLRLNIYKTWLYLSIFIFHIL